MIKKFIEFFNKEELEVGDYITYKGSRYEVIEFDDFSVTLKDEYGDITTANYNMLKLLGVMNGEKPYFHIEFIMDKIFKLTSI